MKDAEGPRGEHLRSSLVSLFYAGLSSLPATSVPSFVKLVTSEDFVDHCGSADLEREVLIRFQVGTLNPSLQWHVIDGFASVFQEHLKTAFPDWTYRLEQVVASTDTVAVRGTVSGIGMISFLVLTLRRE